MKLVTFTQQENKAEHRLGAFVDGGEYVVDLNRSDARIPTGIIEFLSLGDAAIGWANEAIKNSSPDRLVSIEEIKLKAPIPNPRKIICIGLNYRDHCLESNLPIPDYPAVFGKYNNAVAGPNEAIILPKLSSQVDYEGELAFVIGRRARYVSESDAMRYVAGYLPFNDVSARDYQMRTSQWTIGKTFDTFAPMGPAIVTQDEIVDPHNLDIRVQIGEEVVQESNTSNLIFSIPDLVMYLSEVMTLEPGDIVSTGTPPGVGFARNPQRFLRAGDIVTISIQGLGSLSNPVVAEEP